MKSIKIFDLQKQYNEISKDIKKNIDKVLESGQYILGKNVESLENKIAKFLNIKYHPTKYLLVVVQIMPLLYMQVELKMKHTRMSIHK